jgi:glycosyltransferase involved in cell wall biosynthesis
MPDLSVNMPARTAAATVGRAVRSTLAAMPRDAELVVLDDGSTDDTPAVLHRIEDRRLVVLRNETGGGVAAGLQQLLAATDSRVVARMDADDVTLPGRFQAQERALRSGADVIFSAVVRFGDRVRDLRPTTPVRLGPRALAFGLLLTNPFSHPTLYTRRASLDAVGGYHRCTAEDYELWLRLAADGARLLRMRQPVLGYRKHPGQTSGAEGWTDAAVAEPAMQQAYDALALHLLGVTRDDEATFRSRLAEVAAAMPGNEGRWLRRRVRTSTVIERMMALRPSRTGS